ncbi:TIGR03618 family F420-dependent PPOX class oxidoreductase [Streptomyces sp. NPDC004609]|uniref:TIGR03618 family F420-dependent PPOX class oxidoreductase n=1 Tax=Streptomyces sp. NPDC004609 TaxID=3364704 RepID=UPI0036C03904
MSVLSPEVLARVEGANFWFVGTVCPDGAPHVSPMWLGTEGGLLLFNTAVGRVKEHNLRRDSRLYLSHTAAEDPYDRVQIRGRAVRFVEGERADRDIDLLARKYLGTERFELRVPGERRVSVLIEPLAARRIVGVEKFPAGVLPPDPGTG